jgi:hypothetical protein
MNFEMRVETLKQTLITRFKFKKKEAAAIALEAMTNLDRHVKLQEVAIKRAREARKND